MFSQRVTFEGLRRREGGIVSTRSVLEANDSQADLLGGEPFEASHGVLL